MGEADRTVHSGGGAVFAGDVTAGRDVVINHFTEIRQVTEQLYSRCSAAAGGSEDLLGRLDNLQWIAEIVGGHAEKLQPDIPAGDTQLQRVHRECGSVLSDIRSLAAQIQDSSNSDNDIPMARDVDVTLGEKCDKIRERLMTLQMVLSHIRNDRTAQDAHIIKEAVVRLLDSPADTDDASSIRTFYTTSSIPYVERQMWQELERSLRGQFSTDFLRDNFALIIATVEEAIWDRTALAPADSLDVFHNASEDKPTQPSNEGVTSSENAKPAPNSDLPFSRHETPDPSLNMVDSVLDEPESILPYDAARKIESGKAKRRSPSMMAIYEGGGVDKSGRTWAESLDETKRERLLTFDGGGVKAWSSLIIVERLMREIARYENELEAEFTHYPRQFNVSDLRPCHYFDKMYGTSTGGIIAIALSRLRLSVAQTIGMFRHLLNAMYSNPRLNPLPLSTKYSHKPFEAALVKVVEDCSKDKSTVTKFQWPAEGNNEDALCQTICLTAVHSGQIDEAYLLRTYNHKYDQDILPAWVWPYNGGANDLDIWQVARATTAAPFYFDMLVASVSTQRGPTGFKDGGIRENNPSYCAFSEYASLHGDEVEPSVLLSIGAGREISSAATFRTMWPGPLGSIPAVQRYSQKLAIFKNLLIKTTEGEARHKTMRTIAKGEYRWYKRLNVDIGIEDMKLDEWEAGYDSVAGRVINGGKTTAKIELATQLYLVRDHLETLDGVREYQSPKIVLQQIAEKLVRSRRARELEAMTKGGEKRERWEAYMGKHLPGEQQSFEKYLAHWDYAMLGRK